MHTWNSLPTWKRKQITEKFKTIHRSFLSNDPSLCYDSGMDIKSKQPKILWSHHHHCMGRLITATKPPILQSKLLCFSLLYLFTSIFLALYTSFSQSKCLFRSSPFEPIQSSLFSYPSSYGEHKYAVSTARSTCSSPIYFSGFVHDYWFLYQNTHKTIVEFHFLWLKFGFSLLNSDYWDVLKEIQNLRRNSSFSSRILRYMQGNADSFGGNFSTHRRFSYFNHQDDSTEIPCGFLKKFPITQSGKSHIKPSEFTSLFLLSLHLFLCLFVCLPVRVPFLMITNMNWAQFPMMITDKRKFSWLNLF